jgi:hypothetical protein
MKWTGIENGELPALVAVSGFDAMLTHDANLHYQQNSDSLPIAIVVLHTALNHIEDVCQLIPQLLISLGRLRPRNVTHAR